MVGTYFPGVETPGYILPSLRDFIHGWNIFPGVAPPGKDYKKDKPHRGVGSQPGVLTPGRIGNRDISPIGAQEKNC